MRSGLSAALLALAACAPMTAAEPEAGSGAWLLPGTTWRLADLDGAPFPARVTATLTEDGRVVGQAPCNRFTAAYAGRWPDLTFAPVASTRMACPDLAAEAAFFAALAAVTRADVADDGLTLTGDGVSLRFERL